MADSRLKTGLLCLGLCLGLFSGPVQAAAGVASAHPLATAAGIRILQQGGNAFDAAVAVTATLAVVEPAGSGIGGGGFWLLYDADEEESIMLDGRETAPLAATRDMFLDGEGNAVPGLSINGGLAAAIPGEPAALVWLAKNRGRFPLTLSLLPAIEAAREGFVVGKRFHRLMKWRADVIRMSPAAAEIFLVDGQVPRVGERIIQEDLADTLWTLAVKGHDGFYSGEMAERLVEGVRQAGGIWTLEDLAGYQVVLREPVAIEFNEMKLVSASLPSSGGLVLAETLNILENHDLSAMDGADFAHVLVEAMRRGYRDRAQYMGDPGFVEVPVVMLQDKQYARGLNQSLRMDRATRSDHLAPTWTDAGSGEDTTHFSVIDEEGNMVAATLSINYPFGSGVVPARTGVLLNDEMDDFSAKPGVPNAYGLVGAQANAIEPGKRMLSSMSPTFLETGDRIAAMGTPGGSRIISMVLLAALEFYQGESAETMVNRPRFHHQYLPDSIQLEPGALSEEVISRLEERGHEFKPLARTWGNMQVVMLDRKSGAVTAASDRRGEGHAQVLTRAGWL